MSTQDDSKTKANDKLPSTFKAFVKKFPALADAHESVANA